MLRQAKSLAHSEKEVSNRARIPTHVIRLGDFLLISSCFMDDSVARVTEGL